MRPVLRPVWRKAREIVYGPSKELTYNEKIRLRSPNYNSKILFDQEGNDLIREMISTNLPQMYSRLGYAELACIRFYLQKRSGKKKKYPKQIQFSMRNNAGYFPVNDDLLDKFSQFFLEHIKSVDVMGVWFNDYEDVVCNRYCGRARLVDLDCLNPFLYKYPWSSRLKGKKVLVVHPFVESIKKQYSEKRTLLFENPDVLPEFELKTVKAVQSIAGSPVEFGSWFDAYEHMCAEIKKVDFEIAIIGAGAYGLPLASFVKSIGKQAIHMGGTTQILFGVKGRRWETGYVDTIAKLFNDHWMRPLETEIPSGYRKVEDGCYW